MAQKPPSPAPPTADLTTLNRLLDRLSHKLLDPSSESSLRRSRFERAKVGANLEYARSLLLQLEHDAPQSTKSQSQRSSQTPLQQKRALLKKLKTRLYDLNQREDDAVDELGEGDDSEELVRRFMPNAVAVHPQTTTTSAPSPSPIHPPSRPPDAEAASLLRPRKRPQDPPAPADAASTTGRQIPGMNNNETLLAHHSNEQETLTASLLTLASALKNNTLSFADKLEASNPLVDTAVAGLDKNVTGMKAAESRMGTLRRMTEGRGWWGRISLYAWIAVLWVILLAVVFVLPSLRGAGFYALVMVLAGVLVVVMFVMPRVGFLNV